MGEVIVGKVKELYNNKEIFDKLFGTFEIVVETKDCYFVNGAKTYESFYVTTKSRVDIVAEEVMAVVTSIRGELHETITRLFKSDIPPQVIYKSYELELLEVDASELLLTDDWNSEYPELLMDAIEETITSIQVKDEEGRNTHYPVRVRDIYYLSEE